MRHRFGVTQHYITALLVKPYPPTQKETKRVCARAGTRHRVAVAAIRRLLSRLR